MTKEHIRRRKIAYLYKHQKGKCAITGQELDPKQVHNRWYAQMHHGIPKSDMNQRLYPHFIHSVWNLFLVKAGPHGTFPTPKGIPHLLALRVDRLLAGSPELDATVNMTTEYEIDVKEIGDLLDDLVKDYEKEVLG